MWFFSSSLDGDSRQAKYYKITKVNKGTYYKISVGHTKFQPTICFSSTLVRPKNVGTNELVEFEKHLDEVMDFRKIANYFRGIRGTNLKLLRNNWKITSCNWLDLGTLLGSRLIMPNNLHGHRSGVYIVLSNLCGREIRVGSDLVPPALISIVRASVNIDSVVL